MSPRYALPLFLALLALPASAQPEAPLYGITTCCPNLVVTFDPDTGEVEPIVEVGGQDDLFVATVGSGVYDADDGRVFFVRNGAFIAADLATGEVTELFGAGDFAQFAGFDTGRGVLYAFTTDVVFDPETGATEYTNRLRAIDPDAGTSTEVAVVGTGVSDGAGYEGDLFGTVSGPVVFATGPTRLFTIRNGNLLEIGLPDGTLAEGDVLPLAQLVAYAPDRGTLFTYERDGAGGEPGPVTFSLVEVDPADGSRTVRAQVGEGAFVMQNGVPVYEGDVFVASLGMAVYDAVGDRVFFNRNGTLVSVALADGAVVEHTALGNLRVIGTAPVTTDAEAPAAPGTLGLTSYPNPFRDAARLTVTVDRPQTLEIAAYDLLGRRVAALHRGPVPAGAFTLDGVGRSLPAGTYVLRVQGESVRESLRVTRLN